MLDKVIVGILIFICVLAGAWGWWMENGPVKKEDGEEASGSNDASHEENADQSKEKRN